jgi:hypothetical protein
MKTELREVTPNVAKEMLKRNANNRRLSESHVDFLSSEMLKGNWVFDGQPIRFSESGTLLDGQHRLNAIFKSKISQQLLIITGINSKAFKVMDTGKGRSASDAFGVNGIKNAKGASSATRIIMKIEGGPSTTLANKKMSNTSILDYYNDNPKIGDLVSTSFAYYNAFDKIIPLAYLAAFRYLTSQKNVEMSDEFWNKVCYGLALESKCPANILRKKLISDRISVYSLPKLEKMAMIIKSWNAYRKGQKMSFLKWVKANEKFPKII